MSISEQLRTKLAGRYEIEREIGAGGMATVYLARDTRHARRVALKVLSPELGAVLGVERFLAEIRVTANLQHPNLLPLFDSGEAGGLLFYVMPFVDGESLRDKLTREKQLPIDEAIRIAAAIAAALDYAHRHGVIHRDLKPENILLHDGQPVVADFGIALAVSNAGGGRITQTGLSLGTPQYMSPEQATGDRAIDGRTDIYSLAAVLYEMLAGEPPHAGSTAQAIIAKLMTEEPRSLTLLRRTVPPHVDAALRRALQKLPADRFATAAQFADAITTVRAVTTPLPETAPAGSLRAARPWLPWGVAGAAIVAAIVVAVSRPAPPDPPLPVRFTFPLKGVTSVDPSRAQVVVSPDGSRLLFLGIPSGVPQLYSRGLSDDEGRPVQGTETASAAFFSPDGQWIGFRNADGAIKKVPASGGAPTTIISAGAAGGATWGAGGEIVFVRQTLGLGRVLETGGEPRPFTAIDTSKQEVAHIAPSFLPDGERVLFAILGRSGSQLAIAAPDGRITLLGQPGITPLFVPPSSLIFGALDGRVAMAPFDPDAGKITGPPAVITEGVYVRTNGTLAMATSANGRVLAYLRGVSESRMAIVGGAGAMQVLPGEARRYRHVRVSPDGNRIAIDIATGTATDVWMYEIKSGVLTRITLDGRSADPTWSPDGKRLAFSRTELTDAGIETYEVAADGSTPAKLLVGGPGSQWPAGWGPDGTTFVYDERVSGALMHVSVLRPDGKREVIVESPEFQNRLAAVSPDGRWIAYTSNESGRTEVVIRALNGPGKWQASTSGGTQPVWSRDGKTLYYRDGTHIIAAAVAGGPAFAIASRTPFADDRYAIENTINFDSHPNGKSLVVVVPIDEGSQMSVAVDWVTEAQKRIPTRR